MPRISTTIAACVLVCTSLFAQLPEGWQESFDKGIEALAAGRHDEGIDAFKHCLLLRPEDSTCAYNLTCAYSLKNELDLGFEWLAKTIEWGFAREQSNVDLAESGDADLANLRADERFAAHMATMKKSLADTLEAIEAAWKNPLIVLPEGHETMKDLGAILVLHDTGSTKRAVAESYWKDVASELHLVLIAPSGMALTGRTPEKGMAWFNDFQAFTARYWDAEKSLEPALAAIKANKSIDASRVFIAGEGQGGIVAFNAAMRASNVYAGVLTLDTPIIASMTSGYFPNAVAAGVKVRALVNTHSMYGIGAEQIEMFTEQMRAELTRGKLASEVTTYTLDPERPNLRRELVTKTLRAILPVTEGSPRTPVEAGSGK